MMKISKPILTNDFLLSPVQFTSLSAIAFKNVKNVYDGNEKILLEYEHSSKIEASSRDWIGIFPRGWSTLQQYVTFEWVSQSLPCGNNEQSKENGDLTKRTIHFCPKYHMGSVNGNLFYQFVYISKQIEVLGVSSYFRFDMSVIGDTSLELECLVPVSTKLRSTSVSDIGILMANKISSTTSLDNRTLQTTSIHSLQNLGRWMREATEDFQLERFSAIDVRVPGVIRRVKALANPLRSGPFLPTTPLHVSESFPTWALKSPVRIKLSASASICIAASTSNRKAETDGKIWTKPHVLMNMSDLKKVSAISRKSAGTGDALDPYSSHSEPVFPMSFPMTHCKKCFHFKRGGEFLRSQQVLQSKLKIVMERNRVLEERTQEMKKEVERLQAESKKLKTSFYSTNKEKVAYEKFVKDFIKSLEKDSVVRVVNGNTEFLVKKVNYVGMEEHPRDKKTSKRERELKAVIGLQEITIRNLINSLQEKAKSVQELNQTVKLAQAFSAARNDSRDYGSDAEETLDDVSSSDVTSEYEFSLTKPPPPEEVAVEDTDAVLDDIRRATEMELKDIGISRSLGKSSSRDSASELGLPNLSVRSYQNQTEETRPKKPRLFDNVEDCWPLSENAPKVFQRKILDANTNFECQGTAEENRVEEDVEKSLNEENPSESSRPQSSEPVKLDQHMLPSLGETEGDCANCESYYDACEGFNQVLSPEESRMTIPTEVPEEETPRNPETLEKTEDERQEKKSNFLVTAIVPHDLNVSPPKAVGEWLQEERTDSEEQKSENSDKMKKFTCQLSIDFATNLLQTSSEERDFGQKALESGDAEEVSSSGDLVPLNSEALLKNDSQKDKSLLCYKKANQCLEIKITQLDEKETSNKNYIHQKMVVKFEKDSQSADKEHRNSKFEFNLALSGLGENTKLVRNVESPSIEESGPEVKASPRTVWNDAADDVAEVASLPEIQSEAEADNQDGDAEDGEDKATEILDEPKGEFAEVDLNLYEDSLRYEKNLEFLQQKKEEKSAEEEVSKNKPTAILIQNGQTKLALIRYQ